MCIQPNQYKELDKFFALTPIERVRAGFWLAMQDELKGVAPKVVDAHINAFYAECLPKGGEATLHTAFHSYKLCHFPFIGYCLAKIYCVETFRLKTTARNYIKNVDSRSSLYGMLKVIERVRDARFLMEEGDNPIVDISQGARAFWKNQK